jgi:hypothetical protein
MGIHMIHLTITTGHSRYSPRDECDRRSLALCQDVLVPALVARQQAPLPHLAPYYLTGAADGGWLVATLWCDGPGIGRAPIATWWTAADAAASGMWDSCVVRHCASVGRMQPRPDTTPWVAAWVEVGAALYPDAMAWVGDLERCLAWAWVDHRRQQAMGEP